MMTPLLLCLYLLLLVIDLVVWWAWWWSSELIWIWWFHLVMFLVGVSMFRHEFATLAEKYQTRIVFSPRVYWFFSLASGLFLSALFFPLPFVSFVARGVLISLLLFWIWVQLFDFFPVKTRQVQRIVFWSSLLGLSAFTLLAWWSIRWLFGSIGQQEIPTQEKPEMIDQGVDSGVSLQDIEDMWETWSVTVTWSWIEEGSGVVDTETISWTMVLQVNEPVTYSILLPYLDQKWLLPAVRETPTFTNISKNNTLYISFQRAWWLKMVGTNVNPNRQVRCENFMVLLWLAEGWAVDWSLPVLDAYRKASGVSKSRGSCLTRDQIATQDMLATIQQ